MILDICENGDVLSVLRIVKIVMNIIRIAVPIVLIVATMIIYTKAIRDSDDQLLVKANRLTIKRVLAAVLLIMLPYFVNILVRAFDPNGTTYLSCLNSATVENISHAYQLVAEKEIDLAKETLKRTDYQRALSSVKKIKIASDREALMQELKNIENYITLRDRIYALAQEYNKEEAKKIREELDAITDENVKATLKKELTEALGGKGSLMMYIQDPNDPLYRNLKNFNGTTLKSVLELNGSSVEKLDEQIKQAVESVGVGTREAPVAAAFTLIETLAGYGYRINYDWAGKYYHIGVRGEWGARYTPWACDSYPRPEYCKTKLIWRGLDCSGFVHWALIQGFQDESLGDRYPVESGQKAISLAGQTTAVCDIGDNLFSDKHVTLVAGIDNEHKRYLIAESSGGGVKLSWYSFNSTEYRCRKIKYSN